MKYKVPLALKMPEKKIFYVKEVGTILMVVVIMLSLLANPRAPSHTVYHGVIFWCFKATKYITLYGILVTTFSYVL